MSSKATVVEHQRHRERRDRLQRRRRLRPGQARGGSEGDGRIEV